MASDDTSAREAGRIETPRELVAILLGFVALALLYNVSIPVWNAPDEPHHFEYIQFLLEHHQLPDQSVPERSTSNEGFMPPLYYILGAVTLSLIPGHDTSDLMIPSYRDLTTFAREGPRGSARPAYPPLNPSYVKFRHGRQKNMFLRTPEDHFPFSGSARTIHLLRLPSALMGALTIWLVFQIARELFPNDRGLPLLAAALCGFNPQFTFVHAYINNDGPVILLGTASLWLLGRYLLRRGSPTPTLIALGGCIGLGLLTKTSAALLLPVLGIAILARAWKQPDPFACILKDSLRLGIPVLLVAGWYFARGALIYGVDDPLGWKIWHREYPLLLMPPEHRWAFLTQVFPKRLFTSFWGQFGWLTIWLPVWAYGFYGLLSLLGLIGLGSHLVAVRRRGRFIPADGQLGLLVAALAIFVGNLFIFSMTFTSAQGRLIFPVIAPACLLMAMGIRAATEHLCPLSPDRWQRLALGLALLLAGMNVYALVGILRPVYES